jgi:hypothetical protein
MYGIVLQQMGERSRICEVIDRDEFKVRSFQQQFEGEPSDASATVDCYTGFFHGRKRNG